VDRYTVVWAVDVQDDFIEQWIRADSSGRKRLREIANAIDQNLAIAPDTQGSSIPSDPALKVCDLAAFGPHATAVFEILPDDRIVRVLRISVALDD
jgi:hypothetical protein